MTRALLWLCSQWLLQNHHPHLPPVAQSSVGKQCKTEAVTTLQIQFTSFWGGKWYKEKDYLQIIIYYCNIIFIRNFMTLFRKWFAVIVFIITLEGRDRDKFAFCGLNCSPAPQRGWANRMQCFKYTEYPPWHTFIQVYLWQTVHCSPALTPATTAFYTLLNKHKFQ